jgi:uncharacterized protein (TIGR02186 family)
MRPALLLTGLVALPLAPRAALAAQPDSALVVEPARAAIGVFYGGVRLTVSSELDTGLAVVVLVSGAETDLHLRKQARVWRAFWAPSGEVTFQDVPLLYLLHASSPLSGLAPPALLDELGLGYESLEAQLGRGAAEDEAGARDLFTELVRLKESEGLFQIVSPGVDVVPAGDGGQRARAVLDVPVKAPPGVYRVQLFGFRSGHLAIRREGTFTLTRGTFNGLFDSLAEQHGLLYGITAVVLAMGAGLLVGLVFGSVKAH